MTTKNDWIEHDGRSVPVRHNAIVQVRFEDGTDDTDTAPLSAEYWDCSMVELSNWRMRDGINGIVAYRVVSA